MSDATKEILWGRRLQSSFIYSKKKKSPYLENHAITAFDFGIKEYGLPVRSDAVWVKVLFGRKSRLFITNKFEFFYPKKIDLNEKMQKVWNFTYG